MGLFDDPGPTPAEQEQLDRALAETEKQITRDRGILQELQKREKRASLTIERAAQAAEAGLLTPQQAANIRERQFNILTGFQERTLNLLRGEGPVDPGFERDADERRQQLRQRLVKQLGPDFENTSSGRRALERLEESIQAGRADQRRFELFGSSAESRAIQDQFAGKAGQAVTIADLQSRSPGLFQLRGFQSGNIGLLGQSLDRLSSITAREQARQDAAIAGAGKAIGIGAGMLSGGLLSGGGQPLQTSSPDLTMPEQTFPKEFPGLKFP